MNLPHYVTRYEVEKSTASVNVFTVKGSVITGPNQGQYVTAKAPTKEVAHQEFIRLAAAAYNRRGT